VKLIGAACEQCADPGATVRTAGLLMPTAAAFLETL
jgi:hypothetical protein